MVRSSGPPDFGFGDAVDAIDVLHRHRLHHVDLARQQRRHARGIVADGREDDFVDVAFDLAPVIAIAHEGGAHVGLALAQTVRTGAVGAERRGILDALAAVHRAGGLVGLAPLLAHDEHVRDTSGRMGNGALVSISITWSLILRTSLMSLTLALHVRALDRRCAPA
jgi:hypothetical protein